VRIIVTPTAEPGALSLYYTPSHRDKNFTARGAEIIMADGLTETNVAPDTARALAAMLNQAADEAERIEARERRARQI